MDRKQGLIKNTFIIGLGTSLSKLLSILLVGLYTAYIAPEDFGYYDYIFTAMALLTPLISLQIIEAMYRHLLDTETEHDVSRVITNAIAVIGTGILLSSVVLVFVNLLTDIRLGWILPGYIATTMLLQLFQLSARGLKRNTVFAVSGIIYTAVMLCSNIVLIVFCKMGIEALLLSTMIADVVGIILIEVKIGVFRRVRPSLISGKLLKMMCKYSIPLLPNAVTWQALMLVSRNVIIHFIGLEGNGIFAIALKFPALLIYVFNIFGMAWQESAITEYGADDRNAYYSKTFNLYMRLLLSAMLVLLPITPFVISLLDPSYFEAQKYIPFLYMSSVFQAFANFFATGYLSAKKTLGAFVTTLIGALFGLACLALMPVIGLQAASLAQMVAYFVILAARYIHTRKYFRIHIQWFAFCVLITLTAAYICLYYFVDNTAASVIQFVLAAAIFLMFNKSLMQSLLSMAHKILFRRKQV